MKGHVVRFAIMVGVGDVMDGANRHRHLTDGVDNGQVDDSPAEEGDSAERRTTESSCKALIHLPPPPQQSAVSVKIFISNEHLL